MHLRLEQLAVRHADGNVGLHPLSVHIDAGEQVAIIGPSGAGKTTLLRVLATALRPSTGHLSLAGEDPWALVPRERQRLRSRIGTVHQAPPLPPRQRVVTAVLAGRLGAWPLWKSLVSLVSPRDVPGAHAALARLDLDEKLFARCDELSGGELQRVGIARVLYQAPALVIADEPVSAMDPALAVHTLSALTQDARQRNATLIVSLHAVELALAHFPRIMGVRGGSIAFDKPAAEVARDDLAALYASERQTPEAAAFDAIGTRVRPL